MRIGFVGLGRMGRPMSQALADAGHDVVVYDVSEAAVDEARGAYGGEAAASAADVASEVEALMISVPGPAEDEAVINGAAGVLRGARPGLLVLDTTTIGVALSRAFARRAAEAGVEYLDTPVSAVRSVGGRTSLTFMAGGTESGFQRARPILECIGSNVALVGPAGSGSAAKLLNQVVYFGYMKLFAEAVALGEQSGLLIEPLLQVLGTSSGGIPNIAERFDQLLGRSDRRTSIDTSLSFFELARESLEDPHDVAPVMEAVRASLREASRAGLGAEDLLRTRNRVRR